MGLMGTVLLILFDLWDTVWIGYLHYNVTWFAQGAIETIRIYENSNET